MESMRVMAAASSSRTLVPSSSCSSTSLAAAAAPRGSRHVIASLRVKQKWRAPGIGALRREAVTLTSMRRIAVRAEAVQGDEPLDEKVDKAVDEAGKGAEESKQAWSKSVEDLKAEAQRIAGSTEETATKELEKLKDITNQLLEQAEAARQKLTATAQETAYRQKDNLEYVAENGPEPIKEVVESALSAHYSETPKQGSKIHDFCLGIPYGIFLVAGGLLWFLLSGATSGIRFGLFLGGALLFLSMTSLKVWKRGESSLPYIQGQAAITAAIFIRYFRRYSVNKLFFPTGLTGLISAGMLAFYVYVLTSGGNPPKKQKPEAST